MLGNDFARQIGSLVERGLGETIGRLDSKNAQTVKKTSHAKGNFAEKVEKLFGGKSLSPKTEKARNHFEKELLKQLLGKLVRVDSVPQQMKPSIAHPCRIDGNEYAIYIGAKNVTLQSAHALLQDAIPEPAAPPSPVYSQIRDSFFRGDTLYVDVLPDPETAEMPAEQGATGGAGAN